MESLGLPSALQHCYNSVLSITASAGSIAAAAAAGGPLLQWVVFMAVLCSERLMTGLSVLICKLQFSNCAGLPGAGSDYGCCCCC